MYEISFYNTTQYATSAEHMKVTNPNLNKLLLIAGNKTTHKIISKQLVKKLQEHLENSSLRDTAKPMHSSGVRMSGVDDAVTPPQESNTIKRYISGRLAPYIANSII